LLGKLGGRILRGFPVSGVDVIFGNSSEADRSAVLRRVRDSRRGGRQRRWGGMLGDGPSAGGASGIRGTRTECERGEG
jgi:hypothetical protein